MPDNPTVSPTRLASIRWPAGLLERIDAAVPGSDHPNRNAFVVAAVEAELIGAPSPGGDWHLVRYQPHGGLSGVEYDDEGNRLLRVTILEEWNPGQEEADR